jgi:hypothetical protein
VITSSPRRSETFAVSNEDVVGGAASHSSHPSGRVRRVDDELAERLLKRLLQPHRIQPCGGDPARGGLALADVVAVDHENVGAA